MPPFPLPRPLPALPTLPSPRLATSMDTDLMRAQQGRKRRQRRGSVGSVGSLETCEGSKNVLEVLPRAPSAKSALPPPTQRQERMDAAARPFTLPGLGGIDLGATKELAPNAESPASEGTQDGEGARAVDPLVDGCPSRANSSQLRTPRRRTQSPRACSRHSQMGAAVMAAATTRALPRRARNICASCAAGPAHVRSSSTYLARRSMTYASLPCHGASLSRTLVGGRWGAPPLF
jgi:hypothetical protein